MNNLLSLGLMTFGMKGYQKMLRTQKIEVKYANSHRLRLQSNRWKNAEVHRYVMQIMLADPQIKEISGSPTIGTLLFVFHEENLTEEEFQLFLQELVAATDVAFEEAPVTVLNRLYDEKIKVDRVLRRATLGLVDVDTAVFGFAAFQGLKTIRSTPHAAFGFLWWSYSILERANRKRKP